jgi:hypothetical protein
MTITHDIYGGVGETSAQRAADFMNQALTRL